MTYDGVADRVSGASNVDTQEQFTFQYDGNGNVRQYGDQLLLYDYNNQLTRLTSQYGSLDLTYDGDGEWVKQVVSFTSMPSSYSAEDAARSPGSGAAGRGSARATRGERDAGSRYAPGARQGGLGRIPGTAKSDKEAIDMDPQKSGMYAEYESFVPAMPLHTETTIRPFPFLEIVSTGTRPQRRYFVYVDGGRVATLVETGKYTTAPYFHHTDYYGSEVLVTGADGAVVEQPIAYSPYGVPRNAEHQVQWYGWGTTVAPLFTGVRLTKISPVYLTRFRAYDPRLGRFLQPDPVMHDVIGGIDANPYLYAKGNPARYVDPLGLEGWTGDVPAEPPVPGSDAIPLPGIEIHVDPPVPTWSAPSPADAPATAPPPALGWGAGPPAYDPQLAMEVERLRRENAELRDSNSNLRGNIERQDAIDSVGFWGKTIAYGMGMFIETKMPAMLESSAVGRGYTALAQGHKLVGAGLLRGTASLAARRFLSSNIVGATFVAVYWFADDVLKLDEGVEYLMRDVERRYESYEDFLARDRLAPLMSRYGAIVRDPDYRYFKSGGLFY